MGAASRATPLVQPVSKLQKFATGAGHFEVHCDVAERVIVAPLRGCEVLLVVGVCSRFSGIIDV